jgi:hypothetical protein
MTSIQEFMEELKAKDEKCCLGLLTLNTELADRHVMEVESPKFLLPLPVKFDREVVKLLMVNENLIQELVMHLEAVPIPEMPLWWSFACYERD